MLVFACRFFFPQNWWQVKCQNGWDAMREEDVKAMEEKRRTNEMRGKTTTITMMTDCPWRQRRTWRQSFTSTIRTLLSFPFLLSVELCTTSCLRTTTLNTGEAWLPSGKKKKKGEKVTCVVQSIRIHIYMCIFRLCSYSYKARDKQEKNAKKKKIDKIKVISNASKKKNRLKTKKKQNQKH